MEPDDQRARQIALLQSQHEFPGPFEYRVVVHAEAGTRALEALLVSIGGRDQLLDMSERSSERGNYRSLRIRVQLPDAETVLVGYEAVRGVIGVITVL